MIDKEMFKKYLDPTNNGRWKFFFDVNFKMYGGKFIFSCNLHKDDIPPVSYTHLTLPTNREV